MQYMNLNSLSPIHTYVYLSIIGIYAYMSNIEPHMDDPFRYGKFFASKQYHSDFSYIILGIIYIFYVYHAFHLFLSNIICISFRRQKALWLRLYSTICANIYWKTIFIVHSFLFCTVLHWL